MTKNTKIRQISLQTVKNSKDVFSLIVKVVGKVGNCSCENEEGVVYFK